MNRGGGVQRRVEPRLRVADSTVEHTRALRGCGGELRGAETLRASGKLIYLPPAVPLPLLTREEEPGS